MRYSKVAWLLMALFLFSTSGLSLAQEQYGSQMRNYMRENKADFFVALDALEISFQEALKALDMSTATELSSLDYVFADCVASSVSTQGSAKQLGLDVGVLHDYVSLRLRNDLSSLPICEASTVADQTALIIHLVAWTVGEDYPVAYHIDVQTEILGGGLSGSYTPTPYENSALGYSSAADIEN